MVETEVAGRRSDKKKRRGVRQIDLDGLVRTAPTVLAWREREKIFMQRSAQGKAVLVDGGHYSDFDSSPVTNVGIRKEKGLLSVGRLTNLVSRLNVRSTTLTASPTSF